MPKSARDKHQERSKTDPIFKFSSFRGIFRTAIRLVAQHCNSNGYTSSQWERVIIIIDVADTIGLTGLRPDL